MNEFFIYRIDENNKIIYVSDNWTDFAIQNSADENSIPPDVIGKSLFDFISDKESQLIYEMIVDSVRKKKLDVKIPINCDSPETKRLIEITIKRLPDNHIEFESEIIFIEGREPVKLLDRTIERSKDAVRICSFCKKIAIKDEWVNTEEAIIALQLFDAIKLPMLTHGVCPKCYDAAVAKLK
jgi:hypothetical protein